MSNPNSDPSQKPSPTLIVFVITIGLLACGIAAVLGTQYLQGRGADQRAACAARQEIPSFPLPKHAEPCDPAPSSTSQPTPDGRAEQN